jgi:asparagine synthase (glutamine-hydrolysing)
VRALLASGLVPRRVDPIAVGQYLTYQCVPAPRTIIENVHALPPGSWLTVDREGLVAERRYWDALEMTANTGEARDIDRTGASSVGARSSLPTLLREAAALHLVSDVPVGAFLSGGIDSSAVVALVRAAGKMPHTFSVGLSEQSYDETRYARQVAKLLGAEHTEILLRDRDMLDQLPDALAAMDQPTGDGINTYVIARAVRGAGISVVLSGLGGDELFGGYPSFARLDRWGMALEAWGHAPSGVRRLAAAVARRMGSGSIGMQKAAAMLESDGTLAAVFPILREVLSRQQRHALLTEPWRAAAESEADPYVRLLAEAFAGEGKLGRLACVSYAEMRTYMHDLLLRDTDQMSMAHGLEVRVPLLDHEVVECVMRLPDSMKRANGTPKRLLVESLDVTLPDEVTHRRKQGFTLPFEPWMRGPLQAICEERLRPDRLQAHGILRPDAVQNLWQGFLAGRSDVSWSRLWVLVTFEAWLDQVGL